MGNDLISDHLISLLNKYLVEDHVVEKDGKVGRMGKQLLNTHIFKSYLLTHL